MTKQLLIVLFLLTFSYFFGQNCSKQFRIPFQTKSLDDNKRSDTIDVLHYDLFIDLTNMSNNQLRASCKIHFQSKMNNINGISFDLLGLSVDSVKNGNNNLNYSYNDTLIRINLSGALQISQEDSVEIFYSGTPTTDPSGFGGFYFQGNYAYNLGVGFLADPHNYGRTWHPCFDNFVERATYSIQILSPNSKTGYAIGELISKEVTTDNFNLSKWIMTDPIPSYLACIAVAGYVDVDQNYISTISNDTVPMLLISGASDTTAFKNSFIHLPHAMEAFELRYGPYVWQKVGFVAVPFNGGAMEHATCISYPIFAINGNTNYETLMAHELAHHWWGNLITCQTSEDMWINEGIASYSEAIFLEHLYGYQAYIDELKGVHLDVIQKAHFNDGAFYPLSGVPHSATYGSHTYSKGSTMMHNLRSYLGDSLFFAGLNYLQVNFPFSDMNAFNFRDALEVGTGENLHPFFDNWIFDKGFSGFVIDSIQTEINGNAYDVSVFIQQKLFQASNFFEQIPIEITFVDSSWNEITETIYMDGQYSTTDVSVPFEPVFVYLNKNDKLLNAVTAEMYSINSISTNQNSYAYFRNTCSSLTDSVLFRVEHHRLPPDDFKTSSMNHTYVISPDRYWTIGGIWNNDFITNGRFSFDARNIASGNLDLGLMTDHNGIIFTEDSLVLLYRKNAQEEWHLFDNYQLFTQGSSTDKFGRIEAYDLKQGQYTFGFRKNALAIEQHKKNNAFKLYPNPFNDGFTLELDNMLNKASILIYDVHGKLIHNKPLSNNKYQIDSIGWENGVYEILILNNNQVFGYSSIIKQ